MAVYLWAGRFFELKIHQKIYGQHPPDESFHKNDFQTISFSKAQISYEDMSNFYQ